MADRGLHLTEKRWRLGFSRGKQEWGRFVFESHNYGYKQVLTIVNVDWMHLEWSDIVKRSQGSTTKEGEKGKNSKIEENMGRENKWLFGLLENRD